MNQTSSQYILETSREYSVYTCENRAIPKVADGLKDAQRKALWLMRNRADKIKTVSLAGTMISENLYLHGDTSASGAISMLAAPYVNNVPLLEGIGSFGTRVAPVDGIGAPRYTYVKRGRAAQELMFVDMDIVPVKENYDGSTIEPQHFLPLIPTVLLNGVSGIAVGWSTEILPRSFKSLVDATLAILDGKSIKRIPPNYELYDVNVKHLEENSWEFTGKLSILDSSTIKVTELPPDLTLEKFKERLNSFEDEGKINTYTDRSTAVIDITIKMPRGSIRGWNESRAIEFFKLKQKKSERIVVVDWNGSSIRQYDSAEQLIKDFVDWRLGWYKTRYEVKMAKDDYELNFWKGVKACFNDKLPARLGGIQSREELFADINVTTSKCNLDLKQLERIVNLPTHRWTKDAYNDVLAKIKDLEANVKEYKRILKDPEVRKSIYRNEVAELKKAKF